MCPVPLYDALAADYDRFVNWEGRLSNELPFLIELLEENRVWQVLDAACGTGQHAIALARRGYYMVGMDLSAAMVERARENAARSGVDARFSVAGLGELATPGQMFDAILCLGNSLPHLLTAEDVRAALADFAEALCPKGILLIQNRNYDRVWSQKERFMGPQYDHGDQGEWLFVRFYDFHDETLTFNMVRLRRRGEGWMQDVESTELRPIFRDELTATLKEVGFCDVVHYGGYDGSAFEPTSSGDLIVVARKN